MKPGSDRPSASTRLDPRGEAFPVGDRTSGEAPGKRDGLRLAVAVAVPMLACAIQWLLWDYFQPYMWFLFFPAAYFGAYVGGLRGGLISTAISALLVWYVFMPPTFSFELHGASSAFSIALFLAMGSLFGVAHERLAKARSQSAAVLALAEKRTREAEVTNLRLEEEVVARVRLEKDAERKATELAERAAHQREIERWTRLYAALSLINKAIVRVRSLEELAREVASVTVEFGGFKLAWIGQYQARTREVVPLASAGEPRELMHRFRHDSEEDAKHPCPCGPAIRNDRAYVINALSTDSEMGNWQSEMEAAGIHAAAVFPIRMKGVIWGVFGVYADEPGVFQDKETGLLEQAALDIGYAIENLENESLRCQAEESLRTSEIRRALALDAAQAGTWQWEIATGENLWSEELWRLYGLAPHECEASYEAWRRTVHPDDLESVERSLQEAVRQEVEIHLEWRVAGFKGEERWLMSRGRPLRNPAGRMTHYIGVVIEITGRKRAEQLVAHNLDAMVRLQKLAMKFVRSEGLPEALAEVVDTAIAISGADFGNIQLVDPSTGELRIKAHRGLPQFWLDFWNSSGSSAGSCGAALQRGEQVIVDDVEQSPLFLGSPALGIQLKGEVRAVQSTPLVSRSGKVVGMFSTHFRTPKRFDSQVLQMLDLLARQTADLIEQAQAEEALRESETRLQFALETSQSGAWDLDLVHHTAHRSLGHDRVFGYPELLPVWTYEMFLQHVLPEERSAVDARFRAAIAARSDWGFECRIRRVDGEVRWIWAAGRHVLDPAGQARRMAGIVQDITERKQAEDALRESEHRFRQVTESLPQLVWTCATDGRCDYLSPQWVRYTGRCETDQLGDGWAGQLHPDDRHRVVDGWLQTAAKGGNFDAEFRIRRHDGAYRWFRTLAVALRDEAGRVVRWFGTNTDIDDIKRAEEEIRQLNADLEQRVRERTAQLEAVNKELETFSYSVSHDLRAPLRHVQGFVGMLERELGGGVSEKGRRLLKTVADSSQEMAVLIDDLLAFSRMGRQEMQEASVPLEPLVQEVQRGLLPAIGDRRIDWQVGTLPTVRGDPAMLRQVLVNLLSNAVKYTRPRGTAIIEVGTAGIEDGRAVLFVRDNGVGFDPQYARKLFGVFQRLHNSSEFEGTGIGLANVHRILARHGGRIWADSEPDRGATFFFTLSPVTTHPSPHE